MSDLLRKKGSVLVFSLLVLAIVLSSALSIALVNVSNRKSAASTAQSVQSFQVADTVAEKVMKAIYNGNYAALDGAGMLYSSLNTDAVNTCPNPVNVAVSGGTAKVSFFGSNGASLAAADCSDALWRDKLVSVKVEGSANGAVRVIETAIAPLSSMAWGHGGLGQLGYGKTTSIAIPVSTIGGSKWKSVSAGGAHVIAVRADGTLWAWGLNNHGQLGDGTQVNKSSPIQIGTDTDWKFVSAGGESSLAIKTNGNLYGWGLNTNSQLGDSAAANDQLTPRLNPSHQGEWAFVSMGELHALGITSSGDLYAWGYNGFYQLGDGDPLGQNKNAPTLVSSGGWEVVSAGRYYSLGIKNGKLYSWGRNQYGKLGNGSVSSYNSILTPSPIGNVADNWKSVSAGVSHSLGVQTNGTLWSWGRDNRGQLGNGSGSNNVLSPTQIVAATTPTWQSVSAGNEYSLAIKTNGANQELWAFGDNIWGQLGNGNVNNQSDPIQILGNWQLGIATMSDNQFSIGVRK